MLMIYTNTLKNLWSKMDKLIPVLVDPPLSEGREFICLWLNKNEEAKKPSHYLITKEQLVDALTEVMFEGADYSDRERVLKDLGVE